MSVCLAELVDLASHVCYDTKSKFLSLSRFSMMLADEGDKGLGKSDKSDSKGSVVDHCLDSVVVVELLAVKPECTHEKRELLLESCLLEIESLMELSCRNLESPVKLLEEFMYSVFLLLDIHTFDCKLHDVDGCERQVSSCN